MTKLLSSLPVGTKVVETGTKYNGKPITWLVGGHNHYAQGQTALVSEKIISLKAFDAKEASNTDSDRRDYGNNRYSVSNIRQWLNSNNKSWYSAQHGADAPPNNENIVSRENDYDTEAGFLTNFSTGMRSALVATPLTTAKNTVTDGGGSEVVSDKVFLLSKTEVGLSNVNNIAEGKLLPLFSNGASRIAYPTTEAVAISEYKDTALDSSKPWEYWLRSPVPYTSYSTYGVTSSSGAVLTATHKGSLGIRPAINLSSDMLVSDTPNSSGEYELRLPNLEVKLLSDLPIGAKVVSKGAKYNDNPITWVVGGHDHYAQGQTVLVSEKIISLKPFDAKEATHPNNNIKTSGNNRYGVSNIRQWLNSDETSWYSAQHSADAPPKNANVDGGKNDYDTEAGFLTNFSTAIKNALVTTPLITAKNTVSEVGYSEVVNDKVFLLSNTEVGLANENNIVEGKLLPLFSDNKSRIAYPTAEAVTKSEYKEAANLVTSKPWYYWLRTPVAVYSYGEYYVSPSGGLTSSPAYSGKYGIRPAINVASTTAILDSTDLDGSYEIITASISPADGTNLGAFSTPNEVLSYTVETDAVSITVTEKFNGTPIVTKTVSNGGSYTVTIPSSLWDTAKYGAFRDDSGSMNTVSLELSTGQVYTYPISKVLPVSAKTEEVVKAVNDMANTVTPTHKKNLVDAIGNRATVGGTGSLEDIAKAIESISIESMGGIKIATGTFKTNGSAKASVRGLSFTPKGIVFQGPNNGTACGVAFRDTFHPSIGFVSFGQNGSGSKVSVSMTPVEGGFDVDTGYSIEPYNFVVFG